MSPLIAKDLVTPTPIDPESVIESLVRLTRRRWLFQRAAECVAVGLVIGFFVSGIALIFLTSGGSAHFYFTLCPLLGVAFGAYFAMATMPSITEIVARIDLNLGNDDLLSTAWNARGSTDRWQQTLVYLAARRCEKVRSSKMVPTRIGRRGFVVLAAILTALLTAEMWRGTQPTPRTARILPDEDWSHWATATPAAPGDSIGSRAQNQMEAKAETAPETSANVTHHGPIPRLISANESSRADQLLVSDSAGAGTASNPIASPLRADWTMQADSHPVDSTHLTKVSDDIDATGGNGIASIAGQSLFHSMGLVEFDKNVEWGHSDLTVNPWPAASSGSSSETANRMPSRYRQLAMDFYSGRTSR